MAKIEVEQTFPVPAAHLYTTICDMDSWGEWFTMHGEFVEPPPERLRTNSRYTQSIQVMGMPFTVEFVVTEFRPPMRLVLTGRGTAGLSCQFDFGVMRGTGGRVTKLSMSGDFESPMLNDQLEQVLMDTCTSQLMLSLERLAQVAAQRSVSRLGK